MQRGFTSETGKAARRKRTENETNDEIGSLKKQINMSRAKNKKR